MTRATRRAHRRREAARYRDGFTASKTDGAVTVEWNNGFLTMMAASESTGPDEPVTVTWGDDGVFSMLTGTQPESQASNEMQFAVVYFDDTLGAGRVRKISHRRWQASKWRRR